MPELPDIVVYLRALEQRVLGETIREVLLSNPFLLRTVEPELAAIEGRQVRELARLGKRIAIGVDDDLWLIIHLMIAGRLHWKKSDARTTRRDLLLIRFDNGSLKLTEAGKKRRASLHVVQGRSAMEAHNPGGLEVLDCALDDFRGALVHENRTLKRALTDPRLFSGIGNAYSDEILHRARLSPLQLTRNVSDDQIAQLHRATQTTLWDWVNRLEAEAGGDFPTRVTAFRDEMAVHGKFGQPCASCGETVQRIRYAENECNYCPKCQTSGKILADRSLSRLLKNEWRG